MCQALAFKQKQIVNFYAVLNVRRNADIAEIRTAYRQAARFAHPDKGGSKESFHLIARAFEVLACAATRRSHNRALARLSFSFAVHSARLRSSPLATQRQRWHTTRRKSTIRSQASQTTKAARRNVSGNRSVALWKLRSVLADLAKERRRAVLASLDLNVRKALQQFMEDPQASIATPQVQMQRRCRSTASAVGIKDVKRNGRTKHKAYMHIKALRMYTREQTELDVAVEHQIVLAQMRESILKAGVANAAVWNEPETLYSICAGVLATFGSTEQRMGLSTLLHFKAPQWTKNHLFISPVMSLQEVFHANSRIMKAKLTSWEAFKAEWFQIVQRKWKACKIERMHANMQAARQDKLESELEKAEIGVKRALDCEERNATKRRKQEDRERKEAVATRARAASEERQKLRLAMKQREQRQKWYRRPDLTMEQIMRGPPQFCEVG